MTRRLNLLLLILVALVGVPFYWNFLDSRLGSAQPRHLTIAQLRQLAASIPGGLPLEVRHEMLGRRELMRDAVEAGGGIRDAITVLRAFQILLPDGRTIAIDTGITPERARHTELLDFDAAAQRRVDSAVDRASIRVRLSPPMDAEIARGHPRPPRESGRSLKPWAIAPGVVVIPLDDVAPQMSMVFVRLDGGRELLLTGDVAPIEENWAELHPPSRYYTAKWHRFNRQAQISWLMTINALHRQAPQMTIVEGRDPRAIPQAPRGFAP